MTNPEPRVPYRSNVRFRRGRWLAVAAGSLAAGLVVGMVIDHSASPSVAAAGQATVVASAATSTTTVGPGGPGGRWDPRGHRGEWAGWPGGPAGGKVTSVTPSALTVVDPDGTTTSIPIDRSTIIDHVTAASASAIAPGLVVLAYGASHGSTFDAAVVVFWSPGGGPAATHADQTGGWGPWGRLQGTVRSVGRSSVQLTGANGTSTTVDYGSGTAMLSSAPVAHDTVTVGGYAYLVEQADTGGVVARRVVVADHPLDFLDGNCPWSATSPPAVPPL